MKPVWIFCFFLFATALRLAVTFKMFYWSLFPVQMYDPYVYVLKALEIARGDWTPVHTHAIGWSVFLAPVLRMWGARSIFEQFLVGIVAVSAVSGAIVFPLASLAKKYGLSWQATAGTLFAFSVSFAGIIPENNFFIPPEPLFTFLVLCGLNAALSTKNLPLKNTLAGALGGLAYSVRPNGIMLLPIFMAIAVVAPKTGRKEKFMGAALVAAAFLAASAPMLTGRAAAFGGAFDYGENGKYFAERYVDVWGAAPAPSFYGYLVSHGAMELFNRFVTTGIVLVAVQFCYSLLPSMFFFAYGLSGTLWNPAWHPVFIAMGLWLTSLAPIFHLYYLPRHLFPILPLAFLVAGAGADAILKRIADSKKPFWTAFAAVHVAGLLVFISVNFFISRMLTKDDRRVSRDRMEWSAWAATHLKGTVAAGNGMDIMLHLPDTAVGGKGMLDLYAPQSGIRITYPGKFDRLEDAMPALKAKKASYVVLDDRVSDPLPFVTDKHLEIYAGMSVPPYFKEVYSNYATNSQSKVRIFWIDWKEYGRIESRQWTKD